MRTDKLGYQRDQYSGLACSKNNITAPNKVHFCYPCEKDHAGRLIRVHKHPDMNPCFKHL